MDAKELKAAASLPELLKILGHLPLKQHGHELIYCLSGNKPCFAVNSDHNIWYDHNTGKGGNIIDFAMSYWKITFREALKKLNEHFSPDQLPDYGRLAGRRRHAQKVPYYRIDRTNSLGKTPEITNYLQTKCIWEISQTLLSEVYYYVQDEKGNTKHFFAAGLQNELGAWQIISPYFTGCIGHKAIGFISRSETSVCIFADSINYLSWQADYPDSDDSILILNSPDLLLATIRKVKDFLEVSVLFNRDDTGRLQSAELIRALPQAIDRSALYKGYGSYNEMLVKRTHRTLTRKA